MENILAESLLEISQKTHEDCGINTYHVPYLPSRIYIEAPGIFEIQEVMKCSAYSHLVSRAVRILDDINRDFLHSTSIPDVPCPGSWVRITQAGLYEGDLALVNCRLSEGDVVSIAVVPRFKDSQNKKRKVSGAATPALLDPKILLKFPPNEDNMHIIGSRMFHSSGLEFLLAPSLHSLKIEPRPSEAELALFQSCFERDITHDIEDMTYCLIRHAVKEAFRNESRRLWRAGDRVKILEGPFKDASCFIHEIDEANQIAIVGFGSPTPTRVEVSIEHLERHFIVGDQVRVALGKNKGKMGSIVIITDDVGTIVEGTANQLTEVIPPSILHHILIILPSSKSFCPISRPIYQPLLFLQLVIQLLQP
jgi:ribosomal protein L24